MFDINELKFIDSLIEDYLKFHSGLPLEVRNHILKLNNKVLEYVKDYEEARMVEFEEDMQQLKRIVKLMCFVCENIIRKDENEYDYSIISYDEADIHIIPVNYCPFCGNKLH